MFKSFLFVLALQSASASTLATVDCGGFVSSTPILNLCQGSGHSRAIAIVGPNVGFVPFDPTPLRVEAYANGDPINFVSAFASLSGTYELTVFGSASGCCFTGGGFFQASAGGSVFGSGFVGGDFNGRPGGTGDPLPFVYGVGQSFAIDLFARAYVAGDAVERVGFSFTDLNGNPLSNVTFAVVEIPEPGSFTDIVAASLLLLPLWARKLPLPRTARS